MRRGDESEYLLGVVIFTKLISEQTDFQSITQQKWDKKTMQNIEQTDSNLQRESVHMSGLSHRLPGGRWVNKLSSLPSLPLPSPEGVFAVCEAILCSQEIEQILTPQWSQDSPIVTGADVCVILIYAYFVKVK